jgi:hypothetical protein
MPSPQINEETAYAKLKYAMVEQAYFSKNGTGKAALNLV